MIIWINGAFGVGKTHTSYELVRRTENTFLLDPEKVGFFLRKYVYKSDQYEDFQNHPLWRKQVLDNLIFCDQQDVITVVPMTIVEDEIFDFIIGGLREKDVDVKHFSLIASKSEIKKRLNRRGDKGGWTHKQIDRCLTSLVKAKYSFQIDTEKHNLHEVVELISEMTGIELIKGRPKFIEEKMNWIKVLMESNRRL
jgi:broad-specificity NMP kinase